MKFRKLLNLRSITKIPKNYKLIFGVYFTILLALVYSFMHIPFVNAEAFNEIYFQYYHDFDTNETIFEKNLPTDSKNPNEFILHREMSDHKKVLFYDRSGLTRSLDIPSDKGYLTYPNDGSFFVWYPELGSKIKIFDSLGKFLWGITESRYLKVLSGNTNRILAFSGDGSRIEFLKPDFNSILAIAGFMLISHQIDDSPSKESLYDACFAFLSGDVVFANIKKRKTFRLHLNHPLKSVACNFKKGDLLVQIQKKVKLKGDSNSLEEEKEIITDALIKVSFDSFTFDEQHSTDKFTLDTEFFLPKSYPFSLPIYWQGDDQLVILPVTNENVQVWVIGENAQIKRKYEWPQKFTKAAAEVENFRIDPLKSALLISNTSMIMALSGDGIVFKHEFSQIDRISYKDNFLLVQTPEGVSSFQKF